MLTKVCTKCKTEKPVSEFFRSAKGKYGYRGECKLCHQEHIRNWRQKNTEQYQIQTEGALFCGRCRQELHVSHFGEEKGRTCGRANYCRTCMADRRQETRREALAAYSDNPPFCACCKEHRLEFLSIDHINGGGRQERLATGVRGFQFYRWLKRNGFPKGYRVLCHNCNQSIGFYNYCPHQKECDEARLDQEQNEC